MRPWDRLTGAVVLAFAVYTMIAATRLGYWQGRIPGPGFAPIWIGAGLALCGLILLLRRSPTGSLRRPSPAERTEGRREAVLALRIGAAAVAALLLIPRLGMLAGLALMLVALVKVLGGTWRSAAGTGVVMPLVFYLVFVRWLAVPIPRGPWGF